MIIVPRHEPTIEWRGALCKVATTIYMAVFLATHYEPIEDEDEEAQ